MKIIPEAVTEAFFQMDKNTNSLSDVQYDIVIAGSGIHGAILALEAVRAGYSVALLDKGDFGHSTSANSLKIIHGGIRYLQHADFKRMRESIISRRSMMAFASHLVKPLPCLMPTYGHGIKGREMMRLAFGIYDLIAFDRNRGLKNENHLPRGSAISVDECKRVVPGVREEGLTGGAVWYDAMADNSERLVLEYVKEAARYGAAIANYTEVVQIKTGSDRISGVVVRDVLINEEKTLRCRFLINAAGPWFENLTGGGGSVTGQIWATAINLVVKKQLFSKYAVGLEGYTDFVDKDALIKRGKRLFFFVPWREKYTMIGTTYKPYHGTIDSFSLGTEEILEIVDDINEIYPPAALTLEDVTFVHGGLLPMNDVDENRADSVQLDKSSKVIDHGLEGGSKGILSIKSVKYTTAPDIAARIIKKLQEPGNLGKRNPGSYNVPPRRMVDFDATINHLGNEFEKTRNYLQKKYGNNWREVFSYVVENGAAGKDGVLWISEDPPLMIAELYYFIYEEMATNLSDVVFRRSNLGSAECPDAKTLSLVAEIMGGVLEWQSEERKQQIEQVLEVFAPLEHEVR